MKLPITNIHVMDVFIKGLTIDQWCFTTTGMTTIIMAIVSILTVEALVIA